MAGPLFPLLPRLGPRGKRWPKVKRNHPNRAAVRRSFRPSRGGRSAARFARGPRDDRVDRHRLRAGVSVSHVRGRGVCDPDRLDGPDADGRAQRRRLSQVRPSLPQSTPATRRRRAAAIDGPVAAAGSELSRTDDNLRGEARRRPAARPACAPIATTSIRCGPTCRSTPRSSSTPATCRTQPKYNGDRILVNKYIYTVSDPQRWDVVVFKFPGNAADELHQAAGGAAGRDDPRLPGRLVHRAKKKQPGDADFTIARKPPDVLLAMRQLVHDTNYDPSELYKAGWPLRWQPQSDVRRLASRRGSRRPDGPRALQGRRADDQTAWLRYRHFVPSYDDWRQVEDYTIAAGERPAQHARRPAHRPGRS